MLCIFGEEFFVVVVVYHSLDMFIFLSEFLFEVLRIA